MSLALRHVLDLPLAAELTREEGSSIVLVFLCTTLGAALSRWHLRLILPTVVVEIVLGILIGPEGLDIATVNEYITFLSNFGLALLFFFAGLEVIEQHVPREILRRGTMGWGMSLAIGVAFGVGLESAGVDVTWWLLAVALATTALGTLVPILSDARLLPTPIGQAVLGTGVAGEFWPIIFISVFLTSVYGALTEVLLLVGFGALVAGAATLALRTRPPRVLRILQDTLHTTGQVGVRASIFVLALLVFVAADAGFEFVLGAFAAGVLVGLVLDSPEGAVVRDRLEGIGFGFLVPVYFVVTGMTFDIDSLLTVEGLSLAAIFLALLLVTRGASAFLWLRELGPRGTASLALFGATGLPLIVAIVGIGSERGDISDSVGASLIGAGMISVLVYPFIATRLATPLRGRGCDCRDGRDSRVLGRPAAAQLAETSLDSGSPDPESFRGVIVIVCDSSSHGTTTLVEPLGPKPAGVKLSTAIWTAVAFSVAHVTVTGAVAAAPHWRSPTSNDVTSAGEATVVVVSVVSLVSVVSVVSVEAGQLVSSTVPSVRVVPQRVAPSRFAPEIVASVRFALVRSAPERSVLTICAPERFASVRFASLRLVPSRLALVSVARVRSAPDRSAPDRSTLAHDVDGSMTQPLTVSGPSEPPQPASSIAHTAAVSTHCTVRLT